MHKGSRSVARMEMSDYSNQPLDSTVYQEHDKADLDLDLLELTEGPEAELKTSLHLEEIERMIGMLLMMTTTWLGGETVGQGQVAARPGHVPDLHDGDQGGDS